MRYMKMEMLISNEKAIDIMNGELNGSVTLAKFEINGLNIVIEVQKDFNSDVDCEFIFSSKKIDKTFHEYLCDISQYDLTNDESFYKAIRSELIEYFDIYYNVPTKMGNLFTECCTILICENWFDEVGIDMLDVYKRSLLCYETITTMLDEMNKTNCKIEDLPNIFQCNVMDNGTSINYRYISAFIVYENEKLAISEVYDLETHDPNDNSVVYDVNITLEEIRHRIELLERLNNELNFEEKYKQALKHFSKIAGFDIGSVEYKDKLVYCYENTKDLIDFDFWVEYETLLGEKISYQEYVAIDEEFDGAPMDVNPCDVDIITKWRDNLMKFRKGR